MGTSPRRVTVGNPADYTLGLGLRELAWRPQKLGLSPPRVSTVPLRT